MPHERRASRQCGLGTGRRNGVGGSPTGGRLRATGIGGRARGASAGGAPSLERGAGTGQSITVSRGGPFRRSRGSAEEEPLPEVNAEPVEGLTFRFGLDPFGNH